MGWLDKLFSFGSNSVPSSLVLRSAKGTQLTHAEFDGNFQYLEALIKGNFGNIAPHSINETDMTFFYAFYRTIGAEAWIVVRQHWETTALFVARATDNSGVADLNAAIAAKGSLTYQDL